MRGLTDTELALRRAGEAVAAHERLGSHLAPPDRFKASALAAAQAARCTIDFRRELDGTRAVWFAVVVTRRGEIREPVRDTGESVMDEATCPDCRGETVEPFCSSCHGDGVLEVVDHGATVAMWWGRAFGECGLVIDERAGDGIERETAVGG